MVWYNWLGPSILLGSFAHLCYFNHKTEGERQWLSNTMYASILFGIYVTGVIPRNRFFPDFFFQSNVFYLLYRLYCTDIIGYHCLRKVLHQASPYPHSDYRFGVRCLSLCNMSTRSFTSNRICNNESMPTINTKSLLSSLQPSTLPEVTQTNCIKSQEVSVSCPTTEECELCHEHKQEHINALSKEFFWPLGVTNTERRVVDLAAMADCNVVQRRGGVLVVPVPMFTDNYAYLIFSLATKTAAAVDAADPWSVLRILKHVRTQLNIPFVLTDLLTTHKHWDHAGGNAVLLEYASSKENYNYHAKEMNLVSLQLNIFGSVKDKPKSCTRLIDTRVESESVFTIANGGVVVRVFDVPGHTTGSVMFLVADNENNLTKENAVIHNDDSNIEQMALFTGDSLFVGGCGALFELNTIEEVLQTQSSFLRNTALLMHPTTQKYISPNNILLYVGHEYTEKLLGEVYGSILRSVSRNIAQQNKKCTNGNEHNDNNVKRSSSRMNNAHAVVSSDCAQYIKYVEKAYLEVKAIRKSSDGLTDVAKLASRERRFSNDTHNSKEMLKKHCLPLCTVPSTLAMETRINPFLTITEEAIRSASNINGSLDKAKLERVIFTSTNRRIHQL